MTPLRAADQMIRECFRQLDDLGISQREIAGFLKVDPGRISKIVHGKGRLRANELIAIVQHFGITCAGISSASPQIERAEEVPKTEELLRRCDELLELTGGQDIVVSVGGKPMRIGRAPDCQPIKVIGVATCR